MDMLNDTLHRPFPLPSKKWIMLQSWRNLFFIHWPVPPALLRPHIPDPLQIDTFNGSAWLGIVPFVMEGIYPLALSPFSVTPPFSEINVRTYVMHKGKPGVYFMSLDVQNWASYTIAKRWYRLPYYPAKISFRNEGDFIHYDGIRKGKTNNQAAFSGSFLPTQEVFFAKTGSLEHWLTERYCFYSIDNKGKFFCADIHHSPWQLQKAETEITINTLFSPFTIDLLNEKPISLFSIGVDSLMWNINRIYW
jgi:uncharacterized protein YqjF (DUF2071 family)